LRQVKLDFSWSKGGFDNVMLADFVIKNPTLHRFKDIQITCMHYAPSGTLVDRNVRTIYEIVPKARLIAMLVNPTNPSADTAIADVQNAARAIPQQISLLKASSEHDIKTAFETAVRQRAGGVLVAHDPYFLSRREQFVAFAARHAIPAIYEFSEFVFAGLREPNFRQLSFSRQLRGSNPQGRQAI